MNNHINNILPHLLILLFILISILVIPLFFLNFIYILYKGISFGFLIYLFTISYGIRGLLTSIIYFITTNIIYLLVLLLVLIKGSILSKNVISYFINKDNNTKVLIKKNFLCISIFSLFIVLNDIILYLLSSSIINKVFFMF